MEQSNRSYSYFVFAHLLLCLAIVFSLFAKDASIVYAQTCDPYISPHLRIGINVDQGGGQSIGDYPYEQLNAGWYHNYGYWFKENAPTDIDFLPMFRGDNTSNLDTRLGPTIDAHPGEIWFAGNEPDRIGQDEILPEEYAEFYHESYEFIKGRDPTARIAFGGIVQPTPVRLEYLDRVVTAYNQMYGTNPPADIIHTHAFVMNEISWGAGMPPGGNYSATPQDIEPYEQWDLNIFKDQIRAMRQWMQDNGYQQKPLIVSEYGLLLPDVFHPNGEAESVDFLESTFDFFINEKDAAIGYAADDNRLVQQFAWFSLNYPKYDFTTGTGLNGGLFYRNTADLTALGSAFADYAGALRVETIDLHVSNMQLSSPSPISTALNPTVTVSVDLVNSGGIVADDTVITLWNGDPQAGGTQIDTALLDVLPACQELYKIEFEWSTQSLPTGTYNLHITAEAASQDLETNAGDNSVNTTVQIETPVNTPTPVPNTPTPVPNTPTPSDTPVPNTPTPSDTPVPNTPTPSDTPVPNTPTPSDTLVPNTPTPSDTPVPSNTPVQNTPTPSNTPVPNTPTSEPSDTPTSVPNTPTSEPSNTPVPNTPTSEPSNTPVPNTPTSEASNTPVPNTPTSEPSDTPTSEPSAEPTTAPVETPIPEPSIEPTTAPVDTPIAIATIPALYVVTTANPEIVTVETNEVVYTISYGYALGSPLEDVKLLAEIVENTQFLAEASDPRWVCPEPSQPGDFCTIDIGTLNAGSRANSVFALRFVYPSEDEEEVTSFITTMSIQVGDGSVTKVNDTTTVMVGALGILAEPDDSAKPDVNMRTLYVPLIEVNEAN